MSAGLSSTIEPSGRIVRPAMSVTVIEPPTGTDTVPNCSRPRSVKILMRTRCRNSMKMPSGVYGLGRPMPSSTCTSQSSASASAPFSTFGSVIANSAGSTGSHIGAAGAFGFGLVWAANWPKDRAAPTVTASRTESARIDFSSGRAYSHTWAIEFDWVIGLGVTMRRYVFVTVVGVVALCSVSAGARQAGAPGNADVVGR